VATDVRGRALLPFDCRATDSFEQFCAIAAAIDDLRPTIATFRLTDLEPPGDAFARIEQRPTGAGVVPTQLHMLGAWEYRDTSSGQRWTNPRYCHDHPWQTSQCSPAERREILRDAASLGVLDRRDVAPRFGITAGSLRQWISRKDVAWEARRYQGRQRLARTVYTIYKWTDRTEQGVIAPFPVPDGTLRAWVQKFVPSPAPCASPTARIFKRRSTRTATPSTIPSASRTEMPMSNCDDRRLAPQPALTPPLRVAILVVTLGVLIVFGLFVGVVGGLL